MKTEELVAALRKCVSFGAGCAGCPFENSGAVDEDWCGDALVRAAADRLEECVDRCARFSEEIMELREQQSNDPLTLDELEEMDGEPVWVLVSSNWRESGVSEGWCIVRFHSDDDRVRVYIYDTRHGARFFAQQDYGISWWAYRHKPEDVSNGKDG